MTILRAKSLTTFSVTPDGANIAIGVADEEGRAGALMLPTDCLRELMMTLPEMMRRALRLQHDDPTLRLVYRTAAWEVERSQVAGTFIVTLHPGRISCLVRTYGRGSFRHGRRRSRTLARARSRPAKAAQRSLIVTQ